MPVQVQTPYKEYTANGVTTVFPLEFDCDKSEYLIVSLDGNEASVGSWTLSGESVVFNTAPANGVIVLLQRNTPYQRTTNYQSYDNSFRPSPVNKDFDLIWWKLQELGVADWILGNRIDALKNYVDERDDELRAYLMEEIRKQGVALDQLEEYYNYLMSRLAQIAVDRGWDSSFVTYNGLNQKQINDGLESFSELLLIDKPLNNTRILVKSYHINIGKGGGYVLFKEDDSITPDNVYSFAGVGGVWYRQNWRNPDIFDAGIKADGTDETIKFKALLKAVSAYFDKTSITLCGKTVKVTDFEIPSNITIYNGLLDFSSSTTILADNKYYNGFIIGANRNGDRTTNPNSAANYVNLPQLKNVGFIKVGFKAPPAGTYGFSTDFIYLTKVDGFIFKHCYGTDTNSNRIFTVVGGNDGTVTTSDIDTFATIDPINGWSSNIEVKYNKFNAGKTFGVNSSGQRLIVPSFRLTGCENIEVAYNNFKNFNFGSLIDAYSRNGSQHDNTCSIDDDVLDIWMSTTSRTAQGGMYVGQSAYNIDTKNNKLYNFIQLGILYEGVSFGECSGNIVTMSDYAKTLAATLSTSRGIDLQPNIRQHPFTAVAGVQGLRIHDNLIKGYKTPLITSGSYDWSLKDLDIHDNHLEGQNGNIAMTLSRCFDIRAHSNKLVNGGLSLGQIKDSTINGNKVGSSSNYALYLTSAEKSNLSLINNEFVVNTGPAIYNGSASGGLIEIQGGKIQAKDGTSALMQNGSGVGRVTANGFSNGIAAKRTLVSQAVSLGAGARSVFNVAYLGVKSGWMVRPQLQSLGDQWTANAIDLGIKASAKNGTVDLLIRNEGSSSVTSTFTIFLEAESYLDNTFLN
ncbi:hypothetical protein I6L27_00070 [Acinetobacter pittii]|uniref:NosD domain-containing protein n=1 Tax=Acinetobacter pittii TaxID=48296 RepID=UPI001C24A405|nr:NosD domain-containing protein [Acinetobacter pittii]QXA07977.1 hypothetical protein I6L27_00070 [Acinetobacter pittii]